MFQRKNRVHCSTFHLHIIFHNLLHVVSVRQCKVISSRCTLSQNLPTNDSNRRVKYVISCSQLILKVFFPGYPYFSIKIYLNGSFMFRVPFILNSITELQSLWWTSVLFMVIHVQYVYKWYVSLHVHKYYSQMATQWCLQTFVLYLSCIPSLVGNCLRVCRFGQE